MFGGGGAKPIGGGAQAPQAPMVATALTHTRDYKNLYTHTLHLQYVYSTYTTNIIYRRKPSLGARGRGPGKVGPVPSFQKCFIGVTLDGSMSRK